MPDLFTQDGKYYLKGDRNQYLETNPQNPGLVPPLPKDAVTVPLGATVNEQTNVGGTLYGPGQAPYEAPGYYPVPAPTTPGGNTPADTSGGASDILATIREKYGKDVGYAAQPSTDPFNMKLETDLQRTLDAINQRFDAMVTQQENVNVENLAEANVLASKAGLTGSPLAASELATTKKYGLEAIDAINAQRTQQIADIYSKVDSSEIAATQAREAQANQGAKDYLTVLDTIQKNAKAHIINLAQGGITLQDAQAHDPIKYQKFLDQAGINQDEAQGLWNYIRQAYQAGLKPFGSPATGYYLPFVNSQGKLVYGNPDLGDAGSGQPIIPGIGGKLSPGQIQILPGGGTGAEGAPQVKSVPFMANLQVIPTVPGKPDTEAGSQADKATSGDPAKGGVAVNDGQGNVYGLSRSQVRSLTKAKVPQAVWGAVAGIVSGNIAPPSAAATTSRSPAAIAIMNGLQALGFDAAKAGLDFLAMQTRLRTLNGPQQTRLIQAVTFAYDSLDIIQKLADAWNGTNLPTLNSAELFAAEKGAAVPITPLDINTTDPTTGATTTVHITDSQQLATLLDAQINDLVSELGTVYKGGNTSTDESLSLAAGNLKSNWSGATLKQAVNLARTNLQIRKNSIAQSAVIPGNPYSPSAMSSLTQDQMSTLLGMGASQGYTEDIINETIKAGYSYSDILNIIQQGQSGQ